MNAFQSKNLAIVNISGFTMGRIGLATGLIGLQGILDVGHLLPSTIRAGDHDFCSAHECTYHRPFVLEVMVGAEV